MQHCVKHEQCPKCAELGNDKSSDNLAVYSDGSTYCFRCGYFETAKGLQNLKERVFTSKPRIVLPQDVSEQLPKKCWDFLGQYSLTKNDTLVNTVLWSEHFDRLIFPYFNDTGLWGWQGRYLGHDKKAKWYSQGDLKHQLHTLGNPRSKVCVIVEDIISAVKVSHCRMVTASPLFGSTITTKRLLQLKKKYSKILIWLDDDMKSKSAKFCYNSQSLGLDSSCIFTKQDPKCYNDAEITEIIQCKL
jgi:hypothetical protein